MKRLIYSLSVIMVVILSTALSSCSDKDEPSKASYLIGTWQQTNAAQTQGVNTLYIQFNINGTFTQVTLLDDGKSVQAGYWSYNDGDQLTLYGGTSLPMNYSITKLTDDELTLSAVGTVYSYKKVNDSVIDQYLD